MAFNPMTGASRGHLAVRLAHYRSPQSLSDARLRTTTRTMGGLRIQAYEAATLLFVDAGDIDAV